jgi:hypothetical protein
MGLLTSAAGVEWLNRWRRDSKSDSANADYFTNTVAVYSKWWPLL